MIIEPNQNIAIQFKRGCDVIPVISTITNLAEIVTKIALKILHAINENTFNQVTQYPLIRDIQRKSYGTCLLLAIPILNIYFAIKQNKASDNPLPTSTPRVTRVTTKHVSKEEVLPTSPAPKQSISSILEQTFTPENIIKVRLQDDQYEIDIIKYVMKEKSNGKECNYATYRKENLPLKENKVKTKKFKKKTKNKGLISKIKRGIAGAGKGVVTIAKAGVEGFCQGLDEEFDSKIDVFLNEQTNCDIVYGIIKDMQI